MVDRIENWRSGGVQPQSLRSGRHRLSREAVLASQRGRIMRAALDELGELGAGGMTVGGLVERAKVSKKTFYENFAGLEECVNESLEAVNLIVGTEVAEAAEAAAAAPGAQPFAKIGALVSEMFAAAADEPVVATAILATGFGLSESKAPAWLLYNTARRHILASYYEEARASIPDLPAPGEMEMTAATGLLEGTLMRALAAGEHKQLPAMAEEVSAAVVRVLSGGSH
jgi:AcrR family transcriptional regulator